MVRVVLGDAGDKNMILLYFFRPRYKLELDFVLRFRNEMFYSSDTQSLPTLKDQMELFKWTSPALEGICAVRA